MSGALSSDAVAVRTAVAPAALAGGGRLRMSLSRKLSLAAVGLVAVLILIEAMGTSWLARRGALDAALRDVAARADRLADRVAGARPGDDPAALLRGLPEAGPAAAAYVTDASGRVLAHPDPDLVGRDLSGLPQVAAALAAWGRAGQVARGLNVPGEGVLAAWRLAGGAGWRVFAEVPASVVQDAVWGALLRSAGLLVLGVLLATLGAGLLARRLVAAIRRLQRGADRFGGGDYSQRIVLSTGDELELLASRFNQMGARLQDGHAAMQAKVAERTRELGLSLEQQTATAEVLEVISRSGSDLDTILHTLADTAARLCRSGLAQIFRRDGEVYRHWVSHDHDAGYGALEEAAAISPGRGTLVGRVTLERRAVHIVDCLADPDYTLKGEAQAGGHRTILGVPLLSRGEPVGVFTVARREVEPFTDRQIKLLTTFADQAVIAIENARLFEQVEARTRELARSLDELHEAQDRLVQTEKLASLGQLTAGIAHEIKNPLNFVNNFAALSADLVDELREVLAGEALGEDARADVEELGEMLKGNLEKVVSHGKRADSIVKNMLLHSREGAGDHRPVDVNALVEESVSLAYHGARAEKPGFNVTLETRLDPAVGSVDLYPQEVTRVLLNLVTNGFYATAKRLEGAREPGFSPTLRICTRDLGPAVEIRVRDNGTGIPEDVKAKIFNPFFTTKPAGEGTGLGLSLSHDIVVKQHGGTLAVETEPGAWTEFTITLPREGAFRRPSPAGGSA